MKLDRLAMLCCVALLAVACSKSDSPPAAAPEAAAAPAPAGDSAVAAAAPAAAPVSESAPELPVDENSPISFESELEFIKDVYKITVHGEGNHKLLVVAATRDKKPVGTPAQMRVDGDVANAYATDLDGDQSAEILVFTRGRGTGKPGGFAGFAFTGDRFTPLSLPELDATQATGYHGGDTFELDKNKIVRKFPIMAGESGNATGQTRTIIYALQPGLAIGVEGSKDS